MWIRTALVLAALGLTTHAHAHEDCGIQLHTVDPNSFSRPNEVSVTHIELDLDVDFSTQQLKGAATLRLARHQDVDHVVLDTRGLKIERILLGPDFATEARYQLGQADPFGGTPLTIELGADATEVRVIYQTTGEGNALQWLTPEQTGTEHPFLYTKSTADRARAWFPCQDTPGVRFTYAANLRVPPELLPLMSASNPKRRRASGTYRFEMPQPIPSYLVAMAVGDLRFRKISDKIGVYAVPALADQAQWEFGDAEKIMEAAQGLYGEYLWGRWDMLIMPKSYPIGGMENPRLNFFNPLLIRGDRSGNSVVAHELAHSWSGNKVTNATWQELWLNEGTTVYAEYRISELVYGSEFAEMNAKIAVDSLHEEVKELKPEEQVLKLDLRGRDPYDGFTAVAYDKGFLFFKMLENELGRDKLDAFMRKYFDHFMFQSMTTERFLAYLKAELLGGDEGAYQKLLIDQWVYQPGVPANAPVVRSRLLEEVDRAVAEWNAGTSAREIAGRGWVPQQVMHFIRKLPEQIPAERLADLDRAFGFTEGRSAVAVNPFLKRVILNGWEPGYAKVESYLTSVGAWRSVTDLYKAMVKTPEGLARARELFARARRMYHPQTTEKVERLLNDAARSTP